MLFRYSNIQHIAIVRLSAMGDVAMTVPVVAQLRREYPGLRITVVTRERFRAFFRDIPQVEFCCPDLNGRHKGLKGMWRLARVLLNEDVGALADLHDVMRTKLLRFFMFVQGARVASIDKGRLDKRALTRKFRKLHRQLKPTVERYREVFSRLGLAIGPPAPPCRVSRTLPEKVKTLAGEKKDTWIGVAPFAQHAGKVYPTMLADALIGLLVERYGRVFVFGGGKHEAAFAEHMQERHPGVTSVVGKLPLNEELDLVSNLDCMVAMDSAAMHMASLEGVRVVSVWGATHPYAGFYGFGQDPRDAVQLDLPCRPCSVYGNRACMYKDYRCLTRIEPATVAARVADVLNRPYAPCAGEAEAVAGLKI